MSDEILRAQLVDVARALVSAGLNRGTSGNASVRTRDGYLVTPSGVPAPALAPSSIVAASLHGDPPPGASTEWRFHRDILVSRPEVGAIVHAHPPFATALACARRPIPAFHYMVAVAGGPDVRCAAYATFGTQELSDRVLAALDGRRACLLANHGLIAVGADLGAALALAIEVEALAEQYHRVLQLGDPVLLDAAEMERVIEKFRTYGAGRGGPA